MFKSADQIILRNLTLLSCLFTLSTGFSNQAKAHQGSLSHLHAIAKRIDSPQELVKGIKSEGKMGDYLLSNGIVSAVIEDLRPSSGIYKMGGLLTDFGRLGPDGQMQYNRMDEMVPIVYPKDRVYTNLRVFVAKTIKIIADGSDGGAAIIRVEGEDGVLPYVAEVMKMKPGALKVAMTIDYVLRPGSMILEIRNHLTNTSSFSKQLHFGYIYFLGDGLKFFVPGHGYGEAALKKEFSKFIAVDSEDVSYGLYNPENPIKVLVDGGAIKGGVGDHFPMEPGAKKSITTYISMGLGDIASAYDPFLGPNESGTLMGRLKTGPTEKHNPLAEIMAFAKGASFPSNISRTNEEGLFRLSLPPGEWEIAATAPNYPLGPKKPITMAKASSLSLDLELPKTGTISYEVRDKKKTLIPATLTFQPIGEHPGHPVYKARSELHGGFERIVFSTTGKGSFPILPGKYTATMSRGLEYELVSKPIEVLAGKTVSLKPFLEHSVDIKGYINSDFHIHSQGSTDTNDLDTDKVASIAANGIELPISTDHDHLADYQPTIKKLGLQNKLGSVVGVELTTVRWGHFNAWPLKQDPEKPNMGAIDWYGKTIPQLFQELRTQLGAQVIQINHPRSKPGFVGGQGWLNNIGYNAKTGLAVQKSQFTLDFELHEILNGKRQGQLPEGRKDWFSFLNQGRKVTATGNSDSHNSYSLEMGYPRNLIQMPTDDPSKAKVEDLIASLKNQRSIVSGGLYVFPEVNKNAKTLGGTFDGKKGPLNLTVKVLGPSYADLKQIELVENGETIKTWDITKNGRIEKATVSFQLKPKRDSWYVVFAKGAKDLAPQYPGANPIGWSNPFWVDMDGDGQFKPLLIPGAPSP